MHIILADTLIEARGWTPAMDALGEYDLKIRKTPEQLKQERQAFFLRHGRKPSRLSPTYKEHRTVIGHKEDDQSVAYFLPGLWPRVKDYLDRNAIAYDVEDNRNMAIRPPLDWSRLGDVDLRYKQDEVLALIAAADCGIIAPTTAFGKSYCIALICKMMPTLNILVTTASTQVVNTLYEYLCRQLPGEVGVMGAGRNTAVGKRVVVSTLKSLPNIAPENVHLVLVDECHAVGDNVAGQDLMRFCFARRFGFSASPIRNDGSAIVMEAILGPVIMKMSYQEAVDNGLVTPMRFTMIPCGRGPDILKKDDLPEFMLKRFSYWINSARNHAIANFVMRMRKSYDGQILIMVSTLEHALHLNRLLPWFKVAYYGNIDMEDMRRKFPKERYPDINLEDYKMTQKQLDIMRRAFAKGTLRWIISTKVFKQGVDFQRLTLLIRADADVSGIEGTQIPGRLSRLDENKPVAYLVDVADSFSPWSARRAAERRQWYLKQGWKEVTEEEIADDLRSRAKEDG